MPVVNRQSPTQRTNKQAAGVLGRIVPVAESADSAGLKFCAYGQSGAGKTTLLSTFPKPILIAVCSGAGETRSIRNVKGIDAVALNDEAELADLVAHQRSTNKYKTFALDHVSGYQDLLLKKVLNVSEIPAQLAWGTATMQQWGEVGSGMKERLRDMLALECHVFIAAQQREFNTEPTTADLLAPYVSTALSPSVTGWLCPAVDYLVQCFKRSKMVPVTRTVAGKQLTVEEERIQYCLRTGPHAVYQTKFRVTKGTPLPSEIVDPTFDKIMALIEGQVK